MTSISIHVQIEKLFRGLTKGTIDMEKRKGGINDLLRPKRNRNGRQPSQSK